MLYMTILDSAPPSDLNPRAVVELTEQVTLKCHGEEVTVVADRTRYSPDAWRRAFTYGEGRDVKDGAPGVERCKQNTVKRGNRTVPMPLDHDEEALKHATRILQGYYSGDIVEKGSMSIATREYRRAVYAALRENKLTEQKIGALGNTRESVTAAALALGVPEAQLDAVWAGAEDMEAAAKRARAIKITLPALNAE